jgi:hypothetical protein
MPCGVCHKKEDCAEETKDYLCGSCVVRLVGLNKVQKRALVDSLYLNGQDEEAEFVLRFFPFGVSSPLKENSPTTKPKLLLRRTANI